MRYAKQVSEDGAEVVVVTEDGGVASATLSGGYMVTTYCQDRTSSFDEDMWEVLAEGKQYKKDWKKKQEVDQEIIEDALRWLCPSEIDWIEEDYYLLTTEFNHQQNKRRMYE